MRVSVSVSVYKPSVLTRCYLCRRERDTTGQLIGGIDEVVAIVAQLVDGSMSWAEACTRLPVYDGVQAVE